MTKALQKYDRYIPSAVGISPRIPEHWSVTKLKHVAAFQVGWTPPTKDSSNFIGENMWATITDLKGRYIENTKSCISKEAALNASMALTPRGSLLFSFKLSVGQIAYNLVPMYTNEAIASFLPCSELPLNYLYYALPLFLIENASTNIYGAKILNQDLIRNTPMLKLGRQEALGIASFLDHETAKIDQLITKQERLIELLKEKRQAVISHAVTKGLDPEVPMKDSGVEWLGEVPEHWNISYLKHVAKIIDCKNRTPEVIDTGDLYVVRTSNVRHGKLVIRGAYRTTETDFKTWTMRGVPPAGSIFFTREAPAGEVCEVPENYKLCMGQRMMNLIPHAADYNSFFLVYLRSESIKNYIAAVSSGSTVTHLRVEQVYNIPVPIPPSAEVVAIADYLNEKLVKLAKLEKKALAVISLLKERRSALISAAVTGKIDVRNWQSEQSTSQLEVNA